MNKELIDLVSTLKNTQSPYDAKSIIWQIRERVAGRSTYEEALAMCVHSEDIGILDSMYPILEEIGMYLPSDQDGKVMILSQIHMILES